MAKSTSHSTAPGLFDPIPAPPAVDPALLEVLGLPPEQVQRVRLVASSLQSDIARFQQQLSSPLVSWEQYDHQAIEANTALAFALKAVAAFLPADLQPLIAQFFDLRAQLVLREVQEEVNS